MFYDREINMKDISMVALSFGVADRARDSQGKVMFKELEAYYAKSRIPVISYSMFQMHLRIKVKVKTFTLK
ncbi:MAG: hypothetical protein PVH12_01860 [Candidatus Bathyarchaeota archaeon]|jgi:hypothetical protein